MKRVFALALALLMVMSLLVGCGSSQQSVAPAAAPDKAAPAETEAKGSFWDQATQPTQAAQPYAGDTETGIVNGTWDTKTTKLGDATTSLLILDQKLENCKELTLYANIEMRAGTHCKDWAFWGRVDGQVKKLGSFELPGGDGETTAEFTFDPTVSIDAIAITPTVPGGYSCSFSIGVINAKLAK